MIYDRKKELWNQIYRLERLISFLEKQVKIIRGYKKVKTKDVWGADPDNLSIRQRFFVQEFPKDLNATKAAIRAGYAKSSAHVRGAELLRMTKIVIALRKEYKRITKRNIIDQDRVIREVSAIAYSNIKSYVKWDTNSITLIDSDMLTEHESAAIKEVSETRTPKTTTVKIKLYDKPQSLMTLCRYLGILDRDNTSETDEERAQKVKNALGKMFGSVPTTPDSDPELAADVPQNIVQFHNKLREMENRIDPDGGIGSDQTALGGKDVSKL